MSGAAAPRSPGSDQVEQPDPQSGPVRVAVIGTGYVGLTAGACLAHIGWPVVCGDIDADKVASLNKGEVAIYEAGLDQVVNEAMAAGRLSFVVGAAAAAAGADIVFLCVPTPQDEDGSADLSYVEAAAKQIGPVLSPGAVVVNKSTVPVGSAKTVHELIGRPDVSVVSNPEFLREGTAVEDFLNPDRVVIGGDAAAVDRVARLYEPLGAPIVKTDAVSAETIKYAANGFLALKLSYANALAAFCEAVGADVGSVVEGVGSDARIGSAFLRPGPGWGGSCFPKDTRALIAAARDRGYDFSMMKNTIEVNEAQQERMVHKIATAVGRDIAAGDDLGGVRVAALGLTYKAGTDDMRGSPALAIVKRLTELGADVAAFDPTTIGDLTSAQLHHLGGLAPQESVAVAVAGSDVVAVLTEWTEFATLDAAVLASAMSGDAVVDTRNVLRPEDIRGAGLRYIGVGRV